VKDNYGGQKLPSETQPITLKGMFPCLSIGISYCRCTPGVMLFNIAPWNNMLLVHDVFPANSN